MNVDCSRWARLASNGNECRDNAELPKPKMLGGRLKAYKLLFIVLVVSVGAELVDPSSCEASNYYTITEAAGPFEVQDLATGDWKSKPLIWAPRSARFRITGEGELDNKYYTVKFKHVPRNTETESVDSTGTFGIVDDTTWVLVDEHVTYRIPKSRLSKKYRLEYGVAYGVLSIPFRLRTKNWDVAAGSSLGGYVGFRQRWLGPNTWLLSVGFSAIPIQDVNADDVDTKFGLTAAAGIIWHIKNDFQFGVILGLDHIGGNAGDAWVHNDDLWLSAGIGFGFVQ